MHIHYGYNNLSFLVTFILYENSHANPWRPVATEFWFLQIIDINMNMYWCNTNQVQLFLRLIYSHASSFRLLKFSFPDFSQPSYKILSLNLVYICIDKTQNKFNYCILSSRSCGSLKQNRSTEGCSKLKRSVYMTSSGKNGLNIRTNASPKGDRTRCPEE